MNTFTSRHSIRICLLVVILYYFTLVFSSTIVSQLHGMVFAFAGFFWLANGIMIATCVVFLWKPRVLVVQMGMVPTLVYLFYSGTRFFNEAYVVLNFPVVVWHVVLTCLLVIVALHVMIELIHAFVSIGLARPGRGGIRRAMSRAWKRRTWRAGIVTLAAWLACTGWSYFGFSQAYLVVDPGQQEFSVAFWAPPQHLMDASFYNTSESVEEMERYRQLNTSFYISTSIEYINSGPIRALYESIFPIWALYGVRFIFDISPNDYITYHLTGAVNDTLRALMDWLEPLDYPNFRGISFDIEPSFFGPVDPISREQYELALRSYDGILSEFKARFPACSAHMIQMEGILFDGYDGDHDLDVAQRTVSVEMSQWDWFGFMTYHVETSFTTSSYRYAYHVNTMVDQFGTGAAQPWVGWWYNPGDIDLPGVYERSMEHVKIAKSTGVREVVLAPGINFAGYDGNHSTTIKRLDDLIAVQAGFTSFSIPIWHNQRLYNDWSMYWRKVVPDYVIANSDVMADFIMGTPGSWLAWTVVAEYALVFALTGAGWCHYHRRALPRGGQHDN